MIAIVPLGNFECDEQICLHENIKIEKTPEHYHRVIINAQRMHLIRHPAQSKSVLIIRGKVVEAKDDNIVRRHVEEIILLLRLYKEGSVFFNFISVDHNNWYDNPENLSPKLTQIGVFFYMGWGHKGIKTTYALKKSDDGHIDKFINKYLGQNLFSQIAYKYFFRSFHEPYSDDRFLSNAIGLENILVNDNTEQSNIRYKFIDRGCFLLQAALPNKNGADYYVKSLKNIYDTRCQLVHSTKNIINWEKEASQKILRNSDHYLRVLLKYLLDKPE